MSAFDNATIGRPSLETLVPLSAFLLLGLTDTINSGSDVRSQAIDRVPNLRCRMILYGFYHGATALHDGSSTTVNSGTLD